MDRQVEQNGILERILADACRVTLLRGPAATGKTSVALEMYQHFCPGQDEMQPGCIVLVPNSQAVAHLKRKLLEESTAGVIVSPQIMTFSSLAVKILASGGDETHSVSAFKRQILLRSIVNKLNDEKKLTVFQKVVDAPGLIVAIDRSIAELKRAAIEPEALEKVISIENKISKDLLEVYKRYQNALLSSNSYDIEGQMWQVRDYLAGLPGDASVQALDGIKAIAVDGFTDFTPTQLEILSHLSNRLQHVLITLAHGDDGRGRMWHWTERTLNNIRHTFGGKLEEIEFTDDSKTKLGKLCQKTFKMEFESKSDSLPDNLKLISAPSLEAEISEVARRIKRLLLNGAKAGSIAVLTRSLETNQYRHAIERIFSQNEIPVPKAPRCLAQEPIVRFLSDVINISSGFKFNDVLKVIKNSYFLPEALGNFGEATLTTAEMLIREGNVFEGREEYAAAAERFLKRVISLVDEIDDEIELGPLLSSKENIKKASQMLERLFELVGEVKKTNQIEKLIKDLQLNQVIFGHSAPVLIARDLRSLTALIEILNEIDTSNLELNEFFDALKEVIAPQQRCEKLVEVLDVLDARALRFDHVFLLGVNEGVFPRHFTDSSLLSEADRKSWSAQGVKLDSRSDLSSREMLLFYLAISRACQSLTISYLNANESGSACMPSNFIHSLLDLYGGLEQAKAQGLLEEISAGQLVLPSEKIANLRDAFNAAVAGLFSRDFAQAADCLNWAKLNASEKLKKTVRGIWSRHRRWLGGQCDSFDGRITEKELLTDLGEKYPKKTIFSASQFDSFGRCPWQFFAKYILNLQPLLQPEQKLEAQSKGIFCHNVLYRVMTALRDEVGGPVDLSKVDKSHLEEVLDKAVGQESNLVEASKPPYPVLWGLQRNQMHEDLREYLLEQASNTEPERKSIAFELAFGMERWNQELHDELSQDEPATIETSAGTIKLRGRIDRVDRIKVDGQDGLLIVDYKTGRLPSNKDINAGRNLQLPLYAAALTKILSENTFGGEFHQIVDGSYRKFSALDKPRGETRDYDERLKDSLDLAGKFVKLISQGRFDLLPTHDCSPWCPYRQICQFAEARQEIKNTGSDLGGEQ